MNKMCVPRGTIEGFQIREGRGGGSDFGEVKLRGKEPPPQKNLKFRQTSGEVGNFKPILKYEQSVCSTWNNRRFSDSGRSGRRLGFRRSEVARKRAAAPRNLEVPANFQRNKKIRMQPKSHTDLHKYLGYD